MAHRTIRLPVRSTIVLFILLSILGPFSSSSLADSCGAEPLRLTLTTAALEDIRIRRAAFEEAFRIARALRWDVPTSEQKVQAFTLLDQAEALIASSGVPLNILDRSGDIPTVIMTVLLESLRGANADLRAVVRALQDSTAEKKALKQKLDESSGDLLELTASLERGYRSAARGDVNLVDRQALIPRRLTLLDSRLASLTLEAPVGGPVRVNVTCEAESGVPLQVRAQLRNLFDTGGDAPVPVPPADSVGVTIQTDSPVGRATMFELDIQAVDPIEAQSLNPCLVLVTQDRLLSVPPEPITPQKNRELAQLLALQTHQLTELRDQARQLLVDPQSQGLEDAIVDVVASQVAQVNRFAGLNALSEIGRIDVELKTDIDSVSDMGNIMSMRMQMMMDRFSTEMSRLSNLLQKIDATQSRLVSALK
jgi:hypothetical protein